MPLLAEDEVRRRIASLAGWELHGREIQRTYAFKGFAQAMTFVNRVAALAEQADHHPDMLVQFSKVTLTLSSHDAGGLTERDFNLASQIDS